MLASFLMAVAIPEAFGDRGLLFAGAYVVIQLGRHSFLTFVASGPGTVERTRAARILIWFLVAGVLWIAGGLADGPARTLLWLLALAIDYAGPLFTFWVPGLPRIPPSAWELEVSHFAERFQLFVILALGESIVVTGATASGEELDAARLAAFAVAFLGHGGVLVGVLQRRVGGRAAAAGTGREPHADGPRRLHVPARRDGRGDHRLRGRRRARDRAPDRGPARRRDRRRRRRAGDLPAGAWCCSGCGWRGR